MRSAKQPFIPAWLRLMLAVSLALVGVLCTIQVSQAAEGDNPPFSMRIDGELFIWSGAAGDFDSAALRQTVLDLTPLAESADRVVTGCSGSIALGATPAVLQSYARLQSDLGPGCAQSTIQGVSEIKETLRFFATQANIGEPLRLDLEFDLSGLETYDVDGWPDASKFLQYALDVRLIEITQTYPDGSVEFGATVGEILATRGLSDGTPFYELISDVNGDLEFVPSDPGEEFVPGQTFTLRVTTERGAQVALWWAFSTSIGFNNRDLPSGTGVGLVEADFGNSLELINAVVRDPADESIVADSGLTSASGFDYLAVPEPGRDLLNLAALSTLVILVTVRRTLSRRLTTNF